MHSIRECAAPSTGSSPRARRRARAPIAARPRCEAMSAIAERASMTELDKYTQRGAGYLPGHMGIVVKHVDLEEVRTEIAIQRFHIAPNGFLHAGTVVTLADTSSGYGC